MNSILFLIRRLAIVEQINANFGWNRANSEISMKFGMSVPDRLLFQKKVLATEKIQYGGHFSRWPPNGPLFYDFA